MLFLLLLLSLTAPVSHAAIRLDRECIVVLAEGATAEELARFWAAAERADQAPPGSAPERRFKQVNLNHRPVGGGGVMETADPTRPTLVHMPDGTVRLYVYGSGAFAFQVREGNMDNLLRGGNQGRHREPVELSYEDGTRMRGPYHTGSLPWDLLPVSWPVEMFPVRHPLRLEAERTGQKFIVVGYGGAMEQPHKFLGADGKGRKVPSQTRGDNFSRSRHAFDVEFKDGKQIWKDRGSIFDHKPGVDRAWVAENHEHGYGGRPVLNEDGSVYRDSDGKAWMIYERVVTELVHYEDGSKVTRTKLGGKLVIRSDTGQLLSEMPRGKIVARDPFLTGMFARRMQDPYRVDPASPEVEIFSTSPPGKPGEHFPSTARIGGGFLVEGFNHFEVTIEGKSFHMIAGSKGDFIAGNTDPSRVYGTALGFRAKGDGPIGRYEPILNGNTEKPDLQDFTADLARRYKIIWGPGRPDLFQDARGDWWMMCHGVREDTLPPGLPRGGWPKTAEDFQKYFRAMFVVPVKWKLKDGKPWLEIDEPRP